jgi:hypothetical protein
LVQKCGAENGALGSKPPVRKISEEEPLARQAEFAALLFKSALRKK